MSAALPRIILLAFVCLPAGVGAHTLGEGYVFLNIHEDHLQGKVEITLEDLDRVLDLDTDNDGVVSDTELEAQIERVRDYLSSGVGIGLEGGESLIEFTDYHLELLGMGKYLAFDFLSAPTQIGENLWARYELIFDADPRHRGFLVMQRNALTGEVAEGEGEKTLIFTPRATYRELNAASVSYWTSFVEFVWQGIWHIWIGIDHILFLLALVLPSVLVGRPGSWMPAGELRTTLWSVVKIVTLFTVAHTITLTLAALSIVQLPSRLVESIIALSVVVAALNNLRPVVKGGIGTIVFLFGLFHGFGFASVLQDLITTQRTLIVDLLGFNLGVEIGQVAIIAVIVPVLYAIRRQRFYVPLVLKAASVVICVLAGLWLVERSLDVSLMAATPG